MTCFILRRLPLDSFLNGLRKKRIIISLLVIHKYKKLGLQLEQSKTVVVDQHQQ